MSLFTELKRRNVFRVAIAYLAASWLIIQVVETLFPIFGLSDALIRIVVTVLVIGFPVTLIFSWLYELTPAGLKLETDIDRTRPRARPEHKRLDRGIIVVLTLALGYFVLDKVILEPARDAAREEAVAQQARSEVLTALQTKTSIAVLPFENQSDDESNEYFSDGVSEELLNLLAEIPQLRVISRSSAFSFKGSDLSIPEIAAKLDVAHVLEGSVRKAGDRVRITAKLIDARSGTPLWTESYDRTIGDVFAIQDEISAAVVEKLKVMLLTEAPSAEPVDPAVYTLYLQAKYLANQFTKESLARAAELYEQALALDRSYAKAWSGLGWVYANQVVSGHRSADEALQLAREATWTALAIDPTDARAYANVGWTAMYFDNNLALAAHHYGRALELDPNNGDILNGAAVLIEVLGRPKQAVALHEYGIARDPVNVNRHSNLAYAYLSAGQLEKAIQSARTVLTLSPERIGAHYLLGTTLLLNGDAQAALEAFSKEVDEEYRTKGRALAFHDLGRASDFEQTFAELRDGWGDEWPSEIAHVYAWIGDDDAAFEWLDVAVAKNEGGLMEQALSPFFKRLHGDPRWQAFLEGRGQSPDQVAAIEFNLALPK